MFTIVQALLELIMLGLAAILTLLFLVFLVHLHTSVIIEALRSARELRAQRELTKQAETSRFTELRSFLEAEMLKLSGHAAGLRTDVQTRLHQLDQNLRSAIERAGNTLPAYIGKFEDRLERGSKSDPNV